MRYILFVEDSPTVREAIGNTLRNSGYTQVSFFDNGAEAWQWISQRIEETGRLEDVGDLLISDIEMPQVDGLHLTKQIKGHDKLKDLPVLLYSSIITADNEKKGRAVGADAQVSKPELKEVVRLADELISTAKRGSRGAALRKVTEAAQSQLGVTAARSARTEETPAEAAPRTSEPPPHETGCSCPASERVEATTAAAEPGQTPAAACKCSQPPVFQPEVPVPDGVDAKLWQTFHRELIGRTADLHEMLERSTSGDRSDELLRAIGRVLHSVKSAAMVIPQDQITRCTHFVEGLMETARRDRGQWPQGGLERYLAWLETLISTPGDINAALAAGRELEADLSAMKPEG